MTNWKKVSVWAICLFVGVSMLVSCGVEQKRTEETKDYTFLDCILNVRMTLPQGWTTKLSDTSYHLPPAIYPLPSEKYIYNMSVTNGHTSESNDVNRFEIYFTEPYYIGDKSIDTFPGIKLKKMKQYGENYLYLADSPRFNEVPPYGVVYIDKKLIMAFSIQHWPKAGITTEMESFFASLHID